MNLIKYKNWYFLFSALLILPGLFFLFYSGLKPSIDFTGGSETEFEILKAKKTISAKDIQDIIQNKVSVNTVRLTSPNTFVVRTQPISNAEKTTLLSHIKVKYPSVSEKSFETIGATIGSETEANALKAVVIASIAITLYIAFAFRKVSNPVASWKYGVAAVIALLHDVLLVVGVFAILGYFFHVEIDSLFITALLTVMGFSVHDTIVVFDRIRENLKKDARLPFELIVNNSMLETLNRSLNTSVTVVLVLFMLLLFGGASTQWFIVALLVGVVSGTYSSIFNASPLLVLWYEFDKKRQKKIKI
ncbi:MAG TPA: protein translocase subunit SecF [Candidatus Levybacteria bacterium]|nr:protein translocase subunit SecF [Candidatus Levybacteria bacterium]